MAARQRHLRLCALRVEQRRDVPLFIFGVNGRLIHQFASVDSAERTKDGVLTGYQRERVAGHVAQILNYLRKDDALLPNAIVVAFSDKVSFAAMPGAIRSEWGTPGQLDIPLPAVGERKPGFIVDGQQRVSALAQLDPRKNFPVVIVSFRATSARLQREQFILVNKTKPLPRDLLNELLPHVPHGQLPKPLQIRRVGAMVLERLRYNSKSPFYARIRGLGTYGEGCNISQAALLAVIERSIRRGGVLAEQKLPDGSADVDAMAKTVEMYFSGVRRIWPYAWDGNPWTSRLVHGVGISAMGNLMEVIMRDVRLSSPKAVSAVARRIKKLKRICAWTEGRWSKLNCAWDQLQNTSQDKRRLAEYIASEYERRR
jgi:DGQHR domain-containing protein